MQRKELTTYILADVVVRCILLEALHPVADGERGHALALVVCSLHGARVVLVRRDVLVVAVLGEGVMMR